MKKQYTIKDLAVELNMHHSTVSRALRDHPDISLSTRKKVNALAERHGYIPNSYARNLRNCKSDTIVIMLPFIRSNVFSGVLAALSELAFKSGYSIMVYQSQMESGLEKLNLKAVMKNRVAGVIASVADRTRNAELFLNLEEHGIPVILFDNVYDDRQFPGIRIDNYTAAYRATKFLIKSGKRNTGFYMEEGNNPIYIERFRAFTNAMKKYRGSVKSELLFIEKPDVDGAAILAEKIEKLNHKPDALLFATDRFAISFLSRAKDIGINIPGDISVIGFDNDPAGTLISPKLTTFAQPVDQVAYHAFRILTSRIERNITEREEIILDMDFIERETT